MNGPENLAVAESTQPALAAIHQRFIEVNDRYNSNLHRLKEAIDRTISIPEPKPELKDEQGKQESPQSLDMKFSSQTDYLNSLNNRFDELLNKLEKAV